MSAFYCNKCNEIRDPEEASQMPNGDYYCAICVEEYADYCPHWWPILKEGPIDCIRCMKEMEKTA